MKSLLRRPILAVVLTLTVFSTTLVRSAWAESPQADHRLPPGVLVFVTLPNVEQAVSKFHQTSYGQLLKDPELEAFRAQVEEKFEEASAKVEAKLGVTVKEVLSLFSGELSIAAVRPIGQTLGGVALIEIGDREDVLNQLLAKAQSALGDKLQTSTESVGGQSVTIWTIDTSSSDDEEEYDEEDGDEEEEDGEEDSEGDDEEYEEEGEEESPIESVSLAWFVKDGTLTIGSGASILQPVVERWDGKHAETFAANAVYNSIIDTCRTDKSSEPAALWYIDPIGLTSAALSISPQTQAAAIPFNAFLPAIGLNKLKAIGGVSEIGTKEFDSINRTLYYIDGPATGVLKVFEMKQTIEAPPAWVPEEAGQFFAFEWDVRGAYDTVASTYDMLLGQPGSFESMVKSYMQNTAELNLHPKKDIIDVFSGLVQGYATVPTPDAPENVQGTLAIGVTDEAKAEALFQFIRSALGSEDVTESDGLKIYHLKGEDSPGVVAIKNNTLFLTGDADQLQTALASRHAAPLASSNRYKEIAKVLPGKMCALIYQDPATQFRAAYESLREGEYDGATEESFDFSVLPPFEVIEKYLSPTASYIVPDAKGALQVDFSLPASKFND